MNMLFAFLGCNFILNVEERCTSPTSVAFCYHLWCYLVTWCHHNPENHPDTFLIEKCFNIFFTEGSSDTEK
jgi:hypothetical protein